MQEIANVFVNQLIKEEIQPPECIKCVLAPRTVRRNRQSDITTPFEKLIGIDATCFRRRETYVNVEDHKSG